MSDVIREQAQGITIRVRAKPRASRSAVLGVRDGAVEVAVAAPPVAGLANRELVRVLSRRLGIARGQVALLSGQTGRIKLVRVTGVSAAHVKDCLDPASP